MAGAITNTSVTNLTDASSYTVLAAALGFAYPGGSSGVAVYEYKAGATNISFSGGNLDGGPGASGGTKFNFSGGNGAITGSGTGTNLAANCYTNPGSGTPPTLTMALESTDQDYKIVCGYYSSNTSSQGNIQLKITPSDGSFAVTYITPTILGNDDTDVLFTFTAKGNSNGQTLLLEWQEVTTTVAYTTWRFAEFKASAAGAAALAGDAADVVTATGGLSTAITITGDALNVATGSGGLLTSILVDANAGAIAAALANLTTSINVDAASVNVVTAAADLTTGGNGSISGDAISVATADAPLSTSIDLTGTSVTLTSANGDITAQIKLDVNAVVEALAAAGLDTGIALNGDAQNVVLATVTVNTSINMIADAQSVATATAQLDGQAAQLIGDASSTVIASGEISTQIEITAAALNEALAAGILSISIVLAGNAENVSTAEASLTTTSAVINGKRGGRFKNESPSMRVQVIAHRRSPNIQTSRRR